VRVLLDENLPVELAFELTGHSVSTVSGIGWQGITNSELLRRASGRFDGLVTMDRSIGSQQNIPAVRLAIILVRAPSNQMQHLRPLIPQFLEALSVVRAGELKQVPPSP
jgi:hypothetical protein